MIFLTVKAKNTAGTYSYHYNLLDHLGNIRYVFRKNPGTGSLEKLQEQAYYPFGLQKVVNVGTNRYLYNSKELQDELGQYDYSPVVYCILLVFMSSA